MKFKPKSLKLFYSRRRSEQINFGDDISPLLVERITGRTVTHARVSQCDYAAIGSIMEMMAERRHKRLFKGRFSPIRIWGSGFIRQGGPISSWMMHPLALRGIFSSERLPVNPGIPLGDPGLLFRRLYDPARHEKAFRWGIVAHYTDLNSPQLKKALDNTANSTLIPLDVPPVETLKLLSRCDFIASSSLHGLVAADTYGIPNWHLSFDDKLDGGQYKFLDYASAIDREHIVSVPVPADGNLEHLMSSDMHDLGYMTRIDDVADRLERALLDSIG